MVKTRLTPPSSVCRGLFLPFQSAKAVDNRAVVSLRNCFQPLIGATLLLGPCSKARGANGSAVAAMLDRVRVGRLSAPFPIEHSFSTFFQNLRHLETKHHAASRTRSFVTAIPLQLPIRLR